MGELTAAREKVGCAEWLRRGLRAGSAVGVGCLQGRNLGRWLSSADVQSQRRTWLRSVGCQHAQPRGQKACFRHGEGHGGGCDAVDLTKLHCGSCPLLTPGSSSDDFLHAPGPQPSSSCCLYPASPCTGPTAHSGLLVGFRLALCICSDTGARLRLQMQIKSYYVPTKTFQLFYSWK